MRRALEGIRVLELARVLAGPYCGAILADLGADVIKIEPPGGDDLRRWGPPFTAGGDSTYFSATNRNKRSVRLDLRNPAAQRVLAQLLAVSDVIIENFRVGGLEQLGFGNDVLNALNPRLIRCSITAYGLAGPLATSPGYDVVIQAFSGLMSVTGEPSGEPMKSGVAAIDMVTGTFAAAGINAALLERERTGRGQHIGVSLLDSALAAMPNLTSGWLLAGDAPERLGNDHPNVAPYGVVRTANGYFVIAVGNDAQWGRLAAEIGRPDLATDLRFASNHARLAHRDELKAILADIFGELSQAELTAILERAQIAGSPINTIPSVLEHEQVEATQAIAEYGANGRIVDSPYWPHAAQHRPAPALGQHTAEVLSSVLGMGPEEVDALANPDSPRESMMTRSPQ